MTTSTHQDMPTVHRTVATQRITVGGLKGGTGKTTTAMMLAFAIAQADTETPIIVVDADTTNASAWEWSEIAGEEWPERIAVHRWPSIHVAKRVRDSIDESAHVVIDTGPSDAAVLRSALHVSDTLVVPVSPTPSEATRLTPTLEAAAEVATTRHIDLRILLTRVVARTRSATDMRAALSNMALPLMAAQIGRQERYAQALGTVPSDVGTYADVLAEMIGHG